MIDLPLTSRWAALARIGAREVPLLAKVDVRIDAREPMGPPIVAPPTRPNTWVTNGDREWLWLGPDEWLVVGPVGSAPEIARDLEARLSAVHHSIVDVSANLTAIELEGERRLDLLTPGCGLDLHPRSWRAGMCAQTVLGRIQVILQEREASTRVFVRPSFAGSLVDWWLAVS